MGANQRFNVEIPVLHTGQADLWSRRTPRNVVRCGRRYGKTKMIVSVATDAGASGLKVGIFAPEYKQLSEPFQEILDRLGGLAKNRSYDGVRTRSGGKIDFWHVIDNELAGRGREYDVILLDEIAFAKNSQMTNVWNKNIVPTMATKPHAQVWAFSTPRGEDPDNFFYQICTDPQFGFQEFHRPSWDNPLVSMEWVEQERARLHPTVFDQEILAQFVDWKGTSLFAADRWLEDGEPVAWPTRCDGVFCTIDTATKTGSKNDSTGVVFWAYSAHGPIRLWVLDWDLVRIEGSLLEQWLPGVLKTLEAYALKCGARNGSAGAFIEDTGSGTILLQQGARRGWPVQPVDNALTAKGKDEKALSVAGYHYRGLIKIVPEAYNKVTSLPTVGGTSNRNHFVSQVTGFRIGDPDAAKRADDLFDCYAVGLSIGLGDTQGI